MALLRMSATDHLLRGSARSGQPCRKKSSATARIESVIGTKGVCRPRTGRRMAPKLPVAVATSSIAAFQADGFTAAALKASVTLAKSPYVAAILSTVEKAAGNERLIKRSGFYSP